MSLCEKGMWLVNIVSERPLRVCNLAGWQASSQLLEVAYTPQPADSWQMLHQ